MSNDATTNPATRVTVTKIIDYCKRENAMQLAVYPKRIEAKKMSTEQANLYYNIIKQLGELASKCEAKGISWESLKALVDKMHKV